MCRLGLFGIFFILGALPQFTQAEILPTSSTSLTADTCRLDIYHLVKNEHQKFVANLQVALITNNTLRQRYVAVKADISHPIGFENIGYYRSGYPVEVFTANWRNNGTKHTVTRLVILGGTSQKQAFDVFTRLVSQDYGHFELRGYDENYRFNADSNDISQFTNCVSEHHR
ncbi:hypothetical protein C9I98_08660 [Photobacterium sanctipauli]|uniref:Uncharacterized protein n=1 Tax=Photobacterium sanctipauli TaxID=1342794 RepID=A0A2T3NV13_9GAMM|nr:hypothetical protein [Photobacterium sanctipauli]PSW20120.1 hypothetical protein C9I98_08660 [Photobacterium sanctipauli]